MTGRERLNALTELMLGTLKIFGVIFIILLCGAFILGIILCIVEYFTWKKKAKKVNLDYKTAFKVRDILATNYGYFLETDLYKYAERCLSDIALSLYKNELDATFASDLLSIDKNELIYSKAEEYRIRQLDVTVPNEKKKFHLDILREVSTSNIYRNKEFLAFLSKSIEDLKVNFPDLLAAALNAQNSESNNNKIIELFISTYLVILEKYLIEYLLFINDTSELQVNTEDIEKRLEQYKNTIVAPVSEQTSSLPNFCKDIISLDVNKEEN